MTRAMLSRYTTLAVLLAARQCSSCSFALANFNMTSSMERWTHANFYNQRRGPDATQARGLRQKLATHWALATYPAPSRRR